ncbi:unnamed protein product [Heligmosomoides polygyrus]|uniref:SET domain-containing protein n=1 Tax=Heligmosomoides polygyrus TaxID=6339 RepID=A0A183FX18_HELPZ|nr:unnamed protein product [Heligmosomoides polygyrus]
MICSHIDRAARWNRYGCISLGVARGERWYDKGHIPNARRGAFCPFVTLARPPPTPRLARERRRLPRPCLIDGGGTGGRHNSNAARVERYSASDAQWRDCCGFTRLTPVGVLQISGFAQESSLEWPFVECSAACTCSLQCGNRVAQKGATIPIEVFRTCDGRGWAVRALRNIRSGAFIGEYTGELLSDAETARPERTDTYFFETRVVSQLYTVDARLYGNFTRFINHSCRPNATVSPSSGDSILFQPIDSFQVGMVVWEAQLEQLSHICIFATENIPKGVEITISYGQSWWDAKVR